MVYVDKLLRLLFLKSGSNTFKVFLVYIKFIYDDNFLFYVDKIMTTQILDQEDTNFLEDLIEELPKIDGNMYKSEAEELGNILYRLTEVPTFSKVKFVCSKCGVESWMEVNLNTYVVSITDLVCDDCNPCEDD